VVRLHAIQRDRAALQKRTGSKQFGESVELSLDSVIAVQPIERLGIGVSRDHQTAERPTSGTEANVGVEPGARDQRLIQSLAAGSEIEHEACAPACAT
jgi:hypothetical protein